MRSKEKGKLYQDILHTGMLLLAALVWGMAFSAQSIGADYVEGWTFLAARSLLAVAAMLPLVLLQERNQRSGHSSAGHSVDTAPGCNSAGAAPGSMNVQDSGHQRLSFSDWKAGFICGFFLCIASGLQQIGIAYTTAAKSGFITALYVVLVPVMTMLVLRRKQPARLWLCIALCVAGLYLLCMKDGLQSISYGDVLTLGSAFCFACQILCVGHFVTRVGALRLTFLQFVTETVIAGVFMLLFEHPTLAGLQRAAVPILYAGVMSSAVGYSLQAIGQRSLNPAVASLAMCMESVFSAIGGWLILGERLSLREGIGCALMFMAIVLAEVPLGRQHAV